MGQMKTFSLRLEQLTEDLYNFGIHSEIVIQECKLLCELGFVDEVNGIIWEFENFIVTNEGDWVLFGYSPEVIQKNSCDTNTKTQVLL